MAAPPGELGKRLVFLSVRGRDTTGLPRTRGKRVLGVGDDVTWDTFLDTVASRLSLRGVKAVYHASTGAMMRSLDELQDIEDLEVEVCTRSLQRMHLHAQACPCARYSCPCRPPRSWTRLPETEAPATWAALRPRSAALCRGCRPSARRCRWRCP